MHSVTSFFGNFPFVGTYALVDIQLLSNLDHVHVLLLGERRLVKECVVLVLNVNDVGRVLYAEKTKYDSKTFFRYITKVLILCLNGPASSAFSESPGLCLNFDFFQNIVTTASSKFFHEKRTAKILEAKSFVSIGKVSCCLESKVDSYCECVPAYVTRTFTFYVSVLRLFFRRDKPMKLTKSDLEELGARIHCCEAKRRKTFVTYHYSSMGIQRWLALDHLHTLIEQNLVACSFAMYAYTKHHIKNFKTFIQ